ncbi:MAG: indole-3-glycerol-phosphate synthase [Deltaproteobacteria bacterium]|jgi:indole-3-glycerol phosphate synthase|nr:indole-3-glycerol-phosphate synthase [Deltaproteobacteria bacterium]
MPQLNEKELLPTLGLKAFKHAKEEEIEHLKEKGPEALREEIKAYRACLSVGPGVFLEALSKGLKARGLAIIAEYKRASPSKGDILLTLSPEDAVKALMEADAFSVLTEEKFFKGSTEYLAKMSGHGIPILRKDFIYHPLQLYATALTPASAVLLIVRLTPSVADLRALILLSESLNISPVVEVYSSEDLDIARSAGAKIILVNARDLETLKLDPINSLRLIDEYPPIAGEFWIAASGIICASDLRICRKMGFMAVLIGTSLMDGGLPKEKLKSYMEALARGK